MKNQALCGELGVFRQSGRKSSGRHFTFIAHFVKNRAVTYILWKMATLWRIALGGIHLKRIREWRWATTSRKITRKNDMTLDQSTVVGNLRGQCQKFKLHESMYATRNFTITAPSVRKTNFINKTKKGWFWNWRCVVITNPKLKHKEKTNQKCFSLTVSRFNIKSPRNSNMSWFYKNDHGVASHFETKIDRFTRSRIPGYRD